MLFGRSKSAAKIHSKKSAPLLIESLEPRCLLSAAIQGYSPAEIRHAYGFDQIAFSDHSVAASGAGQTIAIVDAFNDPKVSADLDVFDRQFGLAPANLQVVSQSGGSSLPSTDAGWAGEISLDVEWAHAIAPGAKILLVEANSSSISDLMNAVDYARHVSGVSTVSMSWGGSEFFNWDGGESPSQTNYDPIFTTPSGHQGVTFFAAAGDSGAQSGVQWPSSSPNVVSVGGTSLFTSDAAGTYSGELGWGGTNGGFSQVESEPTYQQVAQSSGVRTTPDVSYNADPNTGFAVYDSLPFNGTSGWQEVGGTSAGSPQWAALVAIADQGRAINGFDTLDGASQTLPALYATYANADTAAGYAAFTSAFDDVLSGGGSGYHFRWGGLVNTGYTAQAGYDLVTGLGSPKAAAIVSTLASADPTGATSAPPQSGTSSGNPPAPAVVAVSPIDGTFVTSPPASALAGKHGSLKLKLTNTSGSTFNGPVSVTLSASNDATLSGDDTNFFTRSLRKLKLRSGKSKTIHLHFTYPTSVADGTYDFIASIAATNTATTPAVTVAPSAVSIAAPRVDLATSFVSPDGVVSIKPGHKGKATVTVTNVGNVTADGTLRLNLFASTDDMVDASDTLLRHIFKHRIKIRAGDSLTFDLKFRAPADQLPGMYNLLASIITTSLPLDSGSSNDVAIIGTIASA